MTDDLHKCAAFLADELGAVRDQMKAPKARDAALRQALLALCPNGPVTGTRYAVQIVRGSSRRFDRAALPDSILQDPRYWKTVTTNRVTARATREDDASPGPSLSQSSWPARSPAAPMLTGLHTPEERFDVIEPF